jgi:hypothetical protein
VRGLFRQTRIVSYQELSRATLSALDCNLQGRYRPKGATQRLDLIQNQQVLPAWGNRSQKTSGKFGRDHRMTFHFVILFLSAPQSLYTLCFTPVSILVRSLPCHGVNGMTSNSHPAPSRFQAFVPPYRETRFREQGSHHPMPL